MRDGLRVGTGIALVLIACPQRHQAPAPAAVAGTAPMSWADVAAGLAPSVVKVLVAQGEAPERLGGLFAGTPSSLGTGLVVGGDGAIVTCHHVVESAERVRVEFADGRQREAELVSRDVERDLALLRLIALPGDPVPVAARLGAPAALRVGEPVLALGNPLGLGLTVSAGVVSALGRPAASDALYIQTDAAISSGYSGGPLCNARGEVVGLATSVRTDAPGISFALPVEVVRGFLRGEIATRAALGLEVTPLVQADVARLGLGETRGARVKALKPDAPAAAAGLRADDVILEFGGRAVDDAAHLRWLLSLAGSGEIPVVLWRDGGKVTVRLPAGGR